MTRRHAQSAFSLVELSIVLVILGLLVGGILSGQALIKGAALRSVISDHDKAVIAIRTFKDKYQCLPGDCPNIASYFPGEVNGNGDYQLYEYSDERCTFWHQLGRASLLEGKSAVDCDGGYLSAGNSGPALRFGNNSYFTISYIGDVTTLNPLVTFASYGNAIQTFTTCLNMQWCGGAPFTPTEAYSLDMKLDDGNPNTGKVRATINNEYCFPDPAWGYGGYKVQDPDPRCYLVFIDGF